MAFLLYVVLILLTIMIIFATIKIELIVEKFKYNRTTQKELFTDKKQTDKQLSFLIKLRLCIFGKIPIVSIKIDENKLKELEKKKKFEGIEKKLKERINKILKEKLSKVEKPKEILDKLKVVKELKIQLRKINLKIEIGLEDVIATSMIIPILSTIVAYILRNMEIKSEGNQYKIMPKYNLQNAGSQINILLKCIIEVKMIHIMNIMYIIKKQRKVNNHVRTSNRRSYDYSYE